MSLANWLNSRVFSWFHGHHMVYNTCWEDPRLDRAALKLGADDRLMVITSAGCNVLDYALDGPRAIHAVDVNYRQNALLELKVAGIRKLDFGSFFEMFGKGRIDDFGSIYRDCLRSELSPRSQVFWDNHGHYLDRARGNSFYYHGTSGLFAWLVNCYLDRRSGLRESIDGILEAKSVAEQQAIFYGGLSDRFWTGAVRWLMNRDTTLAMVGVPRAQRQQLERHYQGGIAQFCYECIEAVFARLPLGDNYFWRVYLTGRYTPGCCPEYLKEENFHRLKDGLVDRVHVHTSTVTNFLRSNGEPMSRLVLLDHMDWLSSLGNSLLRDEWQAIAERTTPDARILWRSGGRYTDFLDPVEVLADGRHGRLDQLLDYDRELAADLHERDRVHTYGSFHIAQWRTA